MTDPRSFRRRLLGTIFKIGLLTGLLTNCSVRPAAAVVSYQNNIEDDLLSSRDASCRREMIAAKAEVHGNRTHLRGA